MKNLSTFCYSCFQLLPLPNNRGTNILGWIMLGRMSEMLIFRQEKLILQVLPSVHLVNHMLLIKIGGMVKKPQ